MAQKWTKHRFDMKLVNPANKRKYKVIVVGSGLAGASAASSLSELGYEVECFCFQDSPRRAHSIAAQGGINAAKNYPKRITALNAKMLFVLIAVHTSGKNLFHGY